MPRSFRHGWFHTGDLGYLDADGDLFLTGRSKENINRGGEKIAPAEIEAVLHSHPAVSQAAVFPVPHPSLGEEICVAVVAKDGHWLTTRDVKVHVSEHLAPFKVPRHVTFVDRLPKSSVGKILRKDLTAAFVAEHGVPDDTPETDNPDTEPHHSTASPLESAIAELWADELDVSHVDPDDDFSTIGGDLLSSVRIILAVEKLTGVKIPDEAIDRLETVREMAALLILLGCSPKPPFGKSREKVDRDRLMDAVNDAMHVRNPISPDALVRSENLLEFETARHTIENIATPSELREFLHHDIPVNPGRWFRGPVTAWNMYRRLRRLRRELKAITSSAVHPFDWRRNPVTENADLFSGSDPATAGKTLIVGFSSRAMRLTAPTYQILCSLDPGHHEVLLLRDPTRQHYFSGVPGIGATVEAVARWLEDWVVEHGYGRVVALGTSAGGLPAICVALLNGWPRVMVSGADNPARHPHLEELLGICAGIDEGEHATEVVLAYSAGKERDTNGAKQIAKRLPNARLAGDERFNEHALLYLLARRGELRDFFKQNLTG